MTWLLVILSAGSALIWWGILLAPWRPWSTRERLSASTDQSRAAFDDLTVLIPARDEADVLPLTLHALATQGVRHLLVIDDQSSDDTAAVAAAAGADVVDGEPLPRGWTGKVWALEQGRRRARTAWLLLLDADIELRPGSVRALRALASAQRRQFVSIMAWLGMQNFWERLLMPAFIFFFKLLYPFSLSNRERSGYAAAAGGCVLIDANVLDEIGGFDSIRDAVIDDCALARAVKARGYRTWIGLSEAVISRRTYATLGSIWHMVARTAFTQLGYSTVALLFVTLALALVCWVPVAALAVPAGRWFALAAWIALIAAFVPTLRFYRRSPLWSLAMPVIGTLYLAMTWHSAWRYWRGLRTRWKGRDYESSHAVVESRSETRA